MQCPNCRRQVKVIDGKIERHAPLFKIPGRKTCPSSGRVVETIEGS